ncbi:hypothetical protein DNG52_24465, partial [Salmonella enterica]|nr:hypothetical protein [Salmonella enterica]EAQ7353507.1 hypothetical protein [Salmonella enterica]EBI4392932.1 hypothetical protein [Salmonella enterica]EBI9066509.1 hypothetical protein [Salmonella enterica]EBJ0317828.1 hypothetical protein [Salmonella enterica]
MLGAKANRAAKQTSPELIARGFCVLSTTFLKASYRQSPEHIQIPLHIRGDGVGRFTQMKNPA